MFIIAQIPFVDFRILSGKKYDDCFFPNTFTRHYERAAYYRFLGSEKNRFSPNGLPMAERTFFDSKKLLYADRSPEMLQYLYIPRLLFARFFEEEQCFHFDIGLREKIGVWADGRQNISKFARCLLESRFLEFDRRYEPEDNRYSILGLEAPLRDIYLYATAYKNVEAEKKKDHTSEIVFGYPALFIIYDKSEQHFFGNADRFRSAKNMRVRHELLSLKNTFADAWYIGKDGLSKYNQDLRNLRIYLSKLHSYKESTRIVLDYLDRNGMKDLDRDRCRRFLELMRFQMNRERYYGIDNMSFRDLAFYLDEHYNHVTWEDFKLRIESKIQEIDRKAMGKIKINQDGDGQQFIFLHSHDFTVNTGDNNQNVLNSYIQEFGALTETLLKQAENLPENEKERLTEQQEVFLDYVKEPSAKAGMAEKLWNGLKNTLKTVSSYVVLNPEKVDKLLELGEKITGFLN